MYNVAHLVKFARKTASISCLAGLLWAAAAASLTCADMGVQYLTPKILSQAHLEEIIKKEKQKQNCNKEIKGNLSEPDPRTQGAEAFRYVGDSTYHISIHEGSRKSKIGHEVYHICAGHLESPNNIFNYLLLQEPAANLYSLISTFRDAPTTTR